MNSFVFVLLSFVMSAVITAIILPALTKVCYDRGLYDLPDERKVHKRSIPRMGGVVFVPATLVGMVGAMGIASINHPDSFQTFHLSSLVIGSAAVLIYLIGFIDDLLGCSARLKFVVQFCAICAMPLCGLRIDSLYGFLGIYELPLVVSYFLTLFICLLIVNAINLIDGIDGLAACVSLVALVCYGVLFGGLCVPAFTLLCAGLIGSLVVFLLYNMLGTVEGRTKTFMGDSGSLLLGLVLSYFTVKYMMVNSLTLPERADGLLMSYTILLVPCFDLCRVALCRLIKGVSIFHPDRSHLHHKFMASGLNMHRTLVAVLLLQVGYILVNMGLFYLGVMMEWIVVIDVIVFTILNVYLPLPRVRGEALGRKLLIVVNEDRFFLSHRKDIALQAQREGYDVRIVCKDTGHHDVITHMGLPVIELPINPTGMNLREEWRTYRFLRDLYRSEQPAIVHHVGLKNILWGGLAARTCNVPGVVNAVSGLGVLFAGSELSLVARGVLRVMRFSNHGGNVSEIFQNYADKELFLRHKVVDEQHCDFIKGSGVNLSEYACVPEPEEGKVRILFTGRMVKEKGAFTLIDAADRLRKDYGDKVEFLLCGGLTNNPSGIKQEELESRCDGTYIQWLGHRSDIQDLLQQSHIVAFPSYYREGVPRSLIEACSAGRPIVTCNSIGSRDAVEDGVTGYLIEPRNDGELADRLRKLIDNAELRRSMGAKGREKAEREFDIKIVVQHHMDIYKRLIANAQ